MTDLNALAERLEAVRLHLDDIHHRDEIEVLDQAAQALRGMGELERAFDGLYDAACGCATDADIVMHYGYPKAERIIKARAARSALKERGGGE